ncbi:GNAT family N-acetyltransferase [Cytobacillus sp. Sa5YUA1]|uniref:GNAT family N-acetyltransferase n=1 Tax=Cytobacillus stercorigallinarum TaxID=2762240 RepID=A0ABR8QU30_9BACI|nr:GNAT family protein [Cytobacillus stercorigallinarum]MBD7939039.1 GNAT family N-acetyltransferase [Cytobacillus stercorigallinarum]
MRLNTSEEVQLAFYREEHLDILNRFELPETQAKFTALPKEKVAVSDGQYRVVILSKKVPVGFFLLHSTKRVSEYTTNPHAMLLTALSIDYKHQGKGYAKEAMVDLKAFITTHFPDCNEVVLAVNHKNLPAQNLYKNVGFVDTGERKIGKIGEQLILRLEMK